MGVADGRVASCVVIWLLACDTIRLAQGCQRGKRIGIVSSNSVSIAPARLRGVLGMSKRTKILLSAARERSVSRSVRDEGISPMGVKRGGGAP